MESNPGEVACGQNKSLDWPGTACLCKNLCPGLYEFYLCVGQEQNDLVNVSFFWMTFGIATYYTLLGRGERG